MTLYLSTKLHVMVAGYLAVAEKSTGNLLATVAETERFIRDSEKIFKEEERLALIDFLASDPEAGALIPGTGGVRKLRWAAGAKGRRGGARVIYYYYNQTIPLFLLAAYAKSEKEDLTGEEKRLFQAFASAVSKPTKESKR